MLFAGLHVLRRLSSPRHPPDALIRLTLSFQGLLWVHPNSCWPDVRIPNLFNDKVCYCVVCRILSFAFQNPTDTIITQICTAYIFPTRGYCLCLLISAFQFVKDRCCRSGRFANQKNLNFIKAINLILQTLFNLQILWWRQTGSNRWPPACKAGALPTELCPQYAVLVGLGGLEPPTPRLSSVCSNQLSYKPNILFASVSDYR